MLRARKPLAYGLAVVLLVAGYLVLGPARGAREDINDQKFIVGDQLSVVRAQLELQSEQLEVARRQLEVAEQTRDVAKETLERTTSLESLATQTRDIARRTDGKAAALVTLTEQLLALARVLEALIRETEKHAENIDRKTGAAPTAP